MRYRNLIVIFVAALLSSRCAGGFSTPLTSPAAPTPTALAFGGGAWRGAVQSNAVRAASDTAVAFSLTCSQRWEISTQSGSHFEGRMTSEGSGADSDWRCTQTASFTGDVTPDDHVAITFSPGFTPGGCTNVTGGQQVAGSRSGDAIVVEVPYRATCEMARGTGQWADLKIGSKITLTPW